MNRHFDKYIGPFGQIHLAIWTNIFWPPLTTRHLKFQVNFLEKINFAISVILNTVCYLDKYVWLIGQIRFAIWTNKFCHLNKSVVLHRTPVLFNFLQCQQCLPGGITLTWHGLIFKDVKYFSFLTDHDWISQTVTFPNLSGRPFGTHRPVCGPWPEDLI